MSRIHDALKKAAQERASGQSSDIAGPAIHSPISSPSNGATGTVVAATDVLAHTVMLPSPRTDCLRFDEIREHCAHPHWHPSPDANVFNSPSPNAHVMEQFRTLRSRLYQLRSNQSLRSVLVTSSVAAEGKSFVSNNLAQAIVRQPDRRALLIDADLRCPRLHKMLGAPAAPGLIDYLSDGADEMSIIQQGPGQGFCFIPAGTATANPSELLANGKLKALLDRITPVFDWVILDSPPCLPVADASVLADFCDGILLVVRAESTPSATAQKACREMQGRNVVGVVLNGVKETDSYGSGYYYTGVDDNPGNKQR